MAEIFTFPEPAGLFPKRRTMPVITSEPEEEGPRPTRHYRLQRLLFRSRESILQSDEPDLVRDVCLDIDRAQGKLKRICARIESLQEYAVAELQALTAGDTKLSGAIIAALLSQAQR
jgi:hypothetical protein